MLAAPPKHMVKYDGLPYGLFRVRHHFGYLQYFNDFLDNRTTVLSTCAGWIEAGLRGASAAHELLALNAIITFLQRKFEMYAIQW